MKNTKKRIENLAMKIAQIENRVDAPWNDGGGVPYVKEDKKKKHINDPNKGQTRLLLRDDEEELKVIDP